MATSLLILLDDIAAVLDDVAAMTKVAAKKSTGVLGDDLALNANSVTGVAQHRELFVVWQVAKGSALNKLVLIPAALIVSAISTKLVAALLILGGWFLCYEGVHKIVTQLYPKILPIALQHDHSAHNAHDVNAHEPSNTNDEQEKIKGAIRTDFVLSAEIIVISLGAVAPSAPMLTKALVLCLIGAMMTVGVYGLVAFIVKLDDIGLYLVQKGGISARLGYAILWTMPKFMRLLSVVGTLAMFLVGGGILAHNIDFIAHFSHNLAHAGMFLAILSNAFNFVVGIIAGALALSIIALYYTVRKA